MAISKIVRSQRTQTYLVWEAGTFCEFWPRMDLQTFRYNAVTLGISYEAMGKLLCLLVTPVAEQAEKAERLGLPYEEGKP